jgi:hypothetical protein
MSSLLPDAERINIYILQSKFSLERHVRDELIRASRELFDCGQSTENESNAAPITRQQAIVAM